MHTGRRAVISYQPGALKEIVGPLKGKVHGRKLGHGRLTLEGLLGSCSFLSFLLLLGSCEGNKPPLPYTLFTIVAIKGLKHCVQRPYMENSGTVSQVTLFFFLFFLSLSCLPLVFSHSCRKLLKLPT